MEITNRQFSDIYKAAYDAFVLESHHTVDGTRLDSIAGGIAAVKAAAPVLLAQAGAGELTTALRQYRSDRDREGRDYDASSFLAGYHAALRNRLAVTKSATPADLAVEAVKKLLNDNVRSAIGVSAEQIVAAVRDASK